MRPLSHPRRAHAEIVRELFELEVPEIEDGIVEIKSIAREAGFRTKLAVWSNDPSVDSVGACIGPRGNRIQTIVGELKNEKIDIVRYSVDPVEYIVNALSPARIISVDILADEEDRKEAFVIVPDDQLSLAIGREGQNVRLAHRLTGWKIDIKSESQAREIENRTVEVQYDEEPQNEEYIEEEEMIDEIAQEAIEETNQMDLDEDDRVVEHMTIIFAFVIGNTWSYKVVNGFISYIAICFLCIFAVVTGIAYHTFIIFSTAFAEIRTEFFTIFLDFVVR